MSTTVPSSGSSHQLDSPSVSRVVLHLEDEQDDGANVTTHFQPTHDSIEFSPSPSPPAAAASVAVTRLRRAVSSATSADEDEDVAGILVESEPPVQHELSPYLNASIFTKVTWTWLDRFMTKGAKQVVTEADLYDLMPIDRADTLTRQIHGAYERAKQRGEQQRAAAAASGKPIDPSGHKTSLWWTLWYAFGVRYFGLQSLLFLYTAFKLVQPLMLNQLVRFISDPDEPAWHGYLYAIAMGLGALGQALVHHTYFLNTVRIGMDVRVALNALIYSKAIKLKTTHFLKTTTGQVINLVSNDSAKPEDLAPYLPYGWSTVFECAIVLGLLYQQVGVAAFAGFGAILCLTPMQLVFSHFFTYYRKFTIARTDSRVKTINEILIGADIMKMMNWESSLEEKVTRVRNEEFQSIFRAAKLKAVNQAAFFASMSVVNVVVFFCMHFRGIAFSPANVFTAISLFNIIKLPLTNFVPMAVEKFAETRIALGRIATFLELDDAVANDQKKFQKQMRAVEEWKQRMEGEATKEPGTYANGSIHMQQASFVWELNEDEAALVAAPTPGESPVEASPSPSPSSASPLVDHSVAPLPAKHVVDVAAKDARQGLKLLDLHVAPGSLVGIIGSIGSYKSSFLAACLGEMTQVHGGALVTGSVSYASQIAWVFAGTIRDNILFGRPFDAKRYLRTIKACQLVDDIRNCPAGDQTVIGEKGVNLSGGQRARVSCARAVYSDADIYLFDDVLAALDSVVAKNLFEAVMSEKGMLAGKTRILVTHQTHLLGDANQLVFLEHGRIKSHGTFDELIKQGHLHESQKHAQQDNDSGIEEAKKLARKKEARERRRRRREEMESNGGVALTKSNDTAAPAGPSSVVATKGDTNSIVKAEVSKVGSLGFMVYVKLARAGGGSWLAILVLLLMLIGQACLIVSDAWLSAWSGQDEDKQVHQDTYAWVYLGLCAGTIVLAIVRARSFFGFILKAASTLHAEMFHHVIFSSMRFFETNPSGRVLNRFAKDQSILDDMLPITSFDFTQCTFMVLGCLIVVGISAPFCLLILIPVIPFFVWLRQRFMRVSRELKRLDATSRSPVYELFSSTLAGLMLIRSFRTEHTFVQNFLTAMDANTRAFLTFHQTARWFGLRLDFAAASVVFCLGLLLVGTRDSISASTAGFALSYVLQLTALFQWCVRQSAEVETMMTSVERIVEYGELPAEGALVIPEYRPPTGWPALGTIEFKDYKMRYRAGLDLVLKGVDLLIAPGEKVGVCGRTGAGKSSLFQAILRLVEADSGAIVIDGMEIGKLGLSDLRSNLAIIPQSPVIFSGSVRYNLDPFNRSTEDQLWAALEAVQLKGLVSGLKDGLESELAEFGSNFSVGECQLICVARALLKPSRILLVDEATANVDSKTDSLIQQVIREKFADRTVLTIAHRLQTIMDYDKIVVMAAGRVAEVGTPKELVSRPPADVMADPNATYGLFSFMANQKKAAGGH